MPADRSFKLKIAGTVVCRTSAFALSDPLEERWEALKSLIGDSSPRFFEVIADLSYLDLQQAPLKTRFAVWKYFNRAKFRPTPFGGFAAITVMPLGNGSGPAVVRGAIKAMVFRDWSGIPETPKLTASGMSGVRLRTNPSLYRAGDQWRYLRFTNGAFQIAALEHSDMLGAVLDACTSERTFGALLSYLTDVHGLSTRAGRAWLNDLVAIGIMLTDRHPNIIGTDHFDRVAIPSGQTGPPYTIALREHVSGTVNCTELEKLPELAEFLCRCLERNENADLEKFKTEFRKRFGEQAVPLMRLMDPETGIGYARLGAFEYESITADLFPADHSLAVPHRVNLTPFHRYLLSGIIKGRPILLEGFEQTNATRGRAFPNTFTALVRSYHGRVVLDHLGGATANALHGRFTLASEEVLNKSKELAKLEAQANPGVLFFDVGYQAEKKVDNINRRAQIYQLELPILSWSESPGQIPLNDVLVTIQADQVILLSKEHHKRIVPKIATAYNYGRSDLALYRFLCDLQHQGLSSELNLHLRLIFPGLDHYPRVTYKGIIISAAAWKVPGAIIHGERTLAAGALRDWLATAGIAYPFKTGETDQTLCFDPADQEAIEMFLQYAFQQQPGDLYITEALQDDGAVNDEEGKRYNGQFLVDLCHHGNIYPVAAVKGADEHATDRPVHPPGGEWCYFEIYSHPGIADEILSMHIRPLVEAFEKDITCWFFIRYDDPSPHIRLRLRATDPAAGQRSVIALKQVLEQEIRNGRVADLQLRTYFPEYERYGRDRLPLVEKTFMSCSRFTLQLIKLPLAKRFRYALSAVGSSIAVILEAPEDQLVFVRAMAESFSEEFGLRTPEFKKINRYSREHLPGDPLTKVPFPRLFDHYLKHIKAAINTCAEAERSKMLADLVHMQVNRIFHAEQRRNEALIYQVLYLKLKKRLTLSSVPLAGSARP